MIMSGVQARATIARLLHKRTQFVAHSVLLPATVGLLAYGSGSSPFASEFIRIASMVPRWYSPLYFHIHQ